MIMGKGSSISILNHHARNKTIICAVIVTNKVSNVRHFIGLPNEAVEKGRKTDFLQLFCKVVFFLFYKKNDSCFYVNLYMRFFCIF